MTAERQDDRRGESLQDRRLRRLLKSAALGGRPDDEFKRRLRRELDHNFRYHRRHQVRATAVTAAIAAVAVVSLRFVDVGGDSFDLTDTGSTAVRSDGDEFTMYVAPFGGDGSGGTAILGDGAVKLNGAQLERIEEMKAAGLGTLKGMSGWEVAGVTKIDLEVDLDLDGGTVTADMPLISPDDAGQETIVEFFLTAAKPFLADIKSGRAPVADRGVMEVMGKRMLVTRWTRDVEGFGSVTYLDGVIIDNLP